MVHMNEIQQSQTHRMLSGLMQRVADLELIMQTINDDPGFKIVMHAWEEDLDTVREEVKGLKGDVGSMKQDVSILQVSVAAIDNRPPHLVMSPKRGARGLGCSYTPMGGGGAALQTPHSSHYDQASGIKDMSGRKARITGAKHRALLEACIMGDEKTALALLQRGETNWAEKDDDGMGSFLWAAARNMQHFCSQLLQPDDGSLDVNRMIDLNVRDYHLRTALHFAALYGNAEVCQLLLNCERFSECEAVDEDGRTALHCAASCGFTEVSSLLLRHHRFEMAIGSLDTMQRTALHSAARGGHRACLISLMDSERFTDFQGRDLDGDTAVMIAAARSHSEATRALLEHPRYHAKLQEDFTALLEVKGVASAKTLPHVKTALLTHAGAEASDLVADIPDAPPEGDESRSVGVGDQGRVCVCGNVFVDDSMFCRMCGSKRLPQDGDEVYPNLSLQALDDAPIFPDDPVRRASSESLIRRREEEDRRRDEEVALELKEAQEVQERIKHEELVQHEEQLDDLRDKFREAMEEALGPQGKSKGPQFDTAMHDFFEMQDRNNDGMVSVLELKVACRKNGVTKQMLSDEDIVDAFMCLDDIDDGKVGHQDIIDWLKGVRKPRVVVEEKPPEPKPKKEVTKKVKREDSNTGSSPLPKQQTPKASRDGGSRSAPSTSLAASRPSRPRLSTGSRGSSSSRLAASRPR